MKSISEILDKYLPADGVGTEREKLRMNLHRELSQLQNIKYNEIERVVHETLKKDIDNGSDKSVELAKCDSCAGTGEKHDYEERMCYKCNGTGTIDERKLWEKIVEKTKSW